MDSLVNLWQGIVLPVLAAGVIGLVAWFGRDGDGDEKDAGAGPAVGGLHRDPDGTVPAGRTWRYGTGYTDGHGYYPTRIG